jgi:hypothetical protein
MQIGVMCLQIVFTIISKPEHLLCRKNIQQCIELDLSTSFFPWQGYLTIHCWPIERKNNPVGLFVQPCEKAFREKQFSTQIIVSALHLLRTITTFCVVTKKDVLNLFSKTFFYKLKQ